MMWGSDKQLENFMVCGAPFGGPIAMISDQKKSTANDGKEKILIYTSAGYELSKIDWDGGSLLAMGWSDHENLVTVTESGKIHR